MIVRALVVGTKKNELDRALGCFGHGAPRLRCHWFCSHCLFVGSGVAGAGCKAVIGQRLKRSGMRWAVTGASPNIAWCCREASS